MSMKSITYGLAIILCALCSAGCTTGFTRLPAGTKAVSGKPQSSPLYNFEVEKIPDVVPVFYPRTQELLLVPRTSRLPVTGAEQSSMTAFDSNVGSLLWQWQVPGCAVAIAKHGRLVFARGYGWSNVKEGQLVQPNSLFRIASVSKSITAVAALKLCEEKRLSLDTRALPILSYAPLPDQQSTDKRLNNITVKELLQCSAGWNRKASGDPMFCPAVGLAAELISPSLRPSPESAIRYALANPLDFEPGTHHEYSNLSYAILGQLISKVAGASYESYVRQNILQPMGIEDMQLGRTLIKAPGEVTYYPFVDQESSRSVFPNYKQPVPLCYGGDFALEANEADSGWIATAPDMVKFACTVFGDRGKAPLSPAFVKEMLARPNLPEWAPGAPYFADGWEVYPNKNPDGQIVARRGSLPGTVSYVGRRADGTTVAFVVNCRPEDADRFEQEITALVWKGADSLTAQADVDLFDHFRSAKEPSSAPK